jgi:trans-4-hydroxy-L-proline dehydratase
VQFRSFHQNGPHLLTDFYIKEQEGKYSLPVMRAKAFYYLLEQKELCLNPGELIAGERGPEPKATPTYPELCFHTSTDLDILNDREKIPYKVDEHTRKTLLNKVLPFWRGRSIRERIFQEVDVEWKDAYNAGIFHRIYGTESSGSYSCR